MSNYVLTQKKNKHIFNAPVLFVGVQLFILSAKEMPRVLVVMVKRNLLTFRKS